MKKFNKTLNQKTNLPMMNLKKTVIQARMKTAAMTQKVVTTTTTKNHKENT